MKKYIKDLEVKSGLREAAEDVIACRGTYNKLVFRFWKDGELTSDYMTQQEFPSNQPSNLIAETDWTCDNFEELDDYDDNEEMVSYVADCIIDKFDNC